MTALYEKARQRSAKHRRSETGAVATMLAWCASSCIAAGFALAVAETALAADASSREPCANARERERCQVQRAVVESCRDEPASTRGECIRTRLPPATAAASQSNMRAEPKPASFRDFCAKQNNPERCEARLEALELCRNAPPQTRNQCIRENMPLGQAHCETLRSGLEKAQCEIWRSAAQPCMDLRGAAARACAASRTPSLRTRHFNSLDCANPGPALAERCTYREIVLAGCGTLPEVDSQKCRLKYLWGSGEIQRCEGNASGKGGCLLQNRVLAHCHGLEDSALDLCLSREERTRDAVLVNCRHDANAVEKEYCAKYDEALAACMNEFADPERFKACVTRTVPATLTLAVQALQVLRIGTGVTH